jgi:hypothetical protein
LLEPEARMELDARGILGIDRRQDRPDADLRRGRDQRFQQTSPEPLPSGSFGHVNGILGREPETHPVVVPVQSAPSDNATVARLGHEDGVPRALMVLEPGQPVFQRARLIIVGRRGLEHGIVVDVQDAGAVGPDGPSDVDFGHSLEVRNTELNPRFSAARAGRPGDG